MFSFSNCNPKLLFWCFAAMSSANLEDYFCIICPCFSQLFRHQYATQYKLEPWYTKQTSSTFISSPMLLRPGPRYLTRGDIGEVRQTVWSFPSLLFTLIWTSGLSRIVWMGGLTTGHWLASPKMSGTWKLYAYRLPTPCTLDWKTLEPEHCAVLITKLPKFS